MTTIHSKDGSLGSHKLEPAKPAKQPRQDLLDYFAMSGYGYGLSNADNRAILCERQRQAAQQAALTAQQQASQLLGSGGLGTGFGVGDGTGFGLALTGGGTGLSGGTGGGTGLGGGTGFGGDGGGLAGGFGSMTQGIDLGGGGGGGGGGPSMIAPSHSGSSGDSTGRSVCPRMSAANRAHQRDCEDLENAWDDGNSTVFMNVFNKYVGNDPKKLLKFLHNHGHNAFSLVEDDYKPTRANMKTKGTIKASFGAYSGLHLNRDPQENGKMPAAAQLDAIERYILNSIEARQRMQYCDHEFLDAHGIERDLSKVYVSRIPNKHGKTAIAKVEMTPKPISFCKRVYEKTLENPASIYRNGDQKGL